CARGRYYGSAYYTFGLDSW
nr:immunoglobulin heavy chain junction region [Macaca mulatta]